MHEEHVEMIADYACKCGENPLWHPEQRCLYWVDIPTGRLFRYMPESDKHEMVFEDGVIGGFTIQTNGELLLFMERGMVMTWTQGLTHPLLEENPAMANGRFNDVIADPEGRVYCGFLTKDSSAGALYRLDPDRRLVKLFDGVGCANGMGFTPDRRQIYFTDSALREIVRFGYNRATGDLTDRALFVTTEAGQGLPDGLTVDAEGYVWSARWNGACVVRHAPDGTIERRIELPTTKVSSVTFGGKDYSDLYITTAGGEDEPNLGKGAGALFRVRTGISGVAEYRSAIQVPD